MGELKDEAIPRLKGYSVCVANGEIFIFGGRTEEGDHENATWKITGYSSPERVNYVDSEGIPDALPRSYHSAVVVGDEMFVFGGILDTIYLCPHQIPFLSLSKRSWDYLDTSGRVPPPTSHNAVCLSPCGGLIFLLGGLSASGECSASLYELNLKTTTWREIELSIPAYWGHTLSAIGNSLLVVGGIEFSNNIESDKLWCIDLNNDYSISLKECPAVTATHRFSKTDPRQHDLDRDEVLLKPHQKTNGPDGWTELYKQVKQLDGSYESVLGWVPSNHFKECYQARCKSQSKWITLGLQTAH
eukprot:TRINITY_DN18537_c0_g1_i2.p1 TRINITY_DN18537_c0_g1~~TRINITY_DN18537_c0_g1_i2.p1  ORF type:complete len:301 (+),score=47.76 TRINITY_DN18537_c0_g1_i2:68-970(+)